MQLRTLPIVTLLSIAAVASAQPYGLSAREVESLYSRDAELQGRAAEAVAEALVNELAENGFEDLSARDLEELYARDPNKAKDFFKKLGGGLKKMVGFGRRDLDELELYGRDAEPEAEDDDAFELYVRDLEELWARDPNKAKDFFKKLGGGLKKMVGFGRRDLELLELHGRDAESEADDDVFEIYAREPKPPKFGSVLRGVQRGTDAVNTFSDAKSAVNNFRGQRRRDASYADPDIFEPGY